MKSLFTKWEHTGSNRGPSACKADALNQLSYAPLKFRSANIGDQFNFKKFISDINLIRKINKRINITF